MQCSAYASSPSLTLHDPLDVGAVGALGALVCALVGAAVVGAALGALVCGLVGAAEVGEACVGLVVCGWCTSDDVDDQRFLDVGD